MSDVSMQMMSGKQKKMDQYERMDQQVVIGDIPLSWRDVVNVARHAAPLVLSRACRERVQQARDVVEQVAASTVPHYGINTGLGALCHVVLEREALSSLSKHTLMSHACGVGAPLREDQVRAIMCCAVINYSHGHSGISPALVERLVQLLNANIVPWVPSRGSVGYLTHMAHIGLVLIGEGEVLVEGGRMAASEVLRQHAITPLELGPKDGLSLVNGTPAMTGLACLVLDDAARVADWAEVAGAMSFEALRGQRDALDPAVTGLKRHPGVQHSAGILRRLLTDSPWLEQCQGDHLQDALSLRSMPQVHGACRDQWEHATRQIDLELQSATDNPLVIAEDGHYRIVSQANPHGASVAMACDVLAMAVAEWGSMSERRSYRLVTPQANDLPAFLTREGGIKSGMMIAQYTAASLAADNKRLAQPAVVDNFLTSGLQEDHLSFGESAALKLDQALENTYQILAIEMLLAAQALDLIEAPGFASGTELARRLIREQVAYYMEEHPLHRDIENLHAWLRHPHSLSPFAGYVG
ncbi:HAL/PAL/TAL family ammonia-lyase [Halomonas binhaiensis]|nr:histidine ammonia-lyase [Halomonas binhaiensis]